MRSLGTNARLGLLATITATVALSVGPVSALPVKPTATPGTDTTPPVVVAPLPAPYIEAVRYVGGNGDQTPDPGERLQVFFSLRNPTDQALDGVTGMLTIKGAGVTVVDQTAAWPDIAAGNVAEASTPFVIQISDGAARAEPCVGGPIVEPAPGTVEPVSSGSAVSSTGETGSGSGSAPGSPGSVDPSGPNVSTPSAVAPPTPSGPEPAQPPAEAPVPFDASVEVHTTASSFRTDFVSGLACPLAARGTTNGRTPTAFNPGGPEIPAAADATPASTRPTGLPLVVAVLLAAAAALIARYRVTA